MSVGMCVVTFAGCGKSAPEPSRPTAQAEEEDFFLPAEERYIEAARPFMLAIVARDFSTAYNLSSSHVRETSTLEEFSTTNRAVFAEMGEPVSLRAIYGVETSPQVLAGPEHVTGEGELNRDINRLVAFNAVGEMPDSIPIEIRRASLKGTVVYGKDDAGRDLSYILTVVLVRENGQLRVGHYWFRERSVFD